MAKSGLDYFPLAVNMDYKIALIEAEFGIKGFGVVVKLFQEIYGGEGYYIEWTDDIRLLFSRKIGVDDSLVSDIVAASIRRGIFDDNLYKKYGLLTSRGIQERYLEAVGRRKRVTVVKEYLLLCNTQSYKNVDISSKNVDISLENADIFSQKKRKEKKREETTPASTSADKTLKNGSENGVVVVFRKLESIKGQCLSPWECERIKVLVDDYGETWCCEALDLMAAAGKIKLNYAEGILNNWRTSGKEPSASARMSDEERARQEWIASLGEEDDNGENYFDASSSPVV